MTKLRSTLSRVLPIIGVSLFAYILYRVGPLSIWQEFKGINLYYFCIAVLLLIPTMLIKAYKWQGILKNLDFHYPLLESFKVVLISYFIGSITPARLGDFSRAAYLKQKGMPLVRGFTSILIDRIFDIGLMLVGAVICVLTFSNLYGATSFFVRVMVVFAICFTIGLFLLTRKNFMRKMLRPFFYFLVPDRFHIKMKTAFDEFYSTVLHFIKTPAPSISLALSTISSWLLAFLSLYFGAMALGIPISYFMILLILPFTTLVEALPISFSGIGTRDAVLILLFTLLGLSSTSAVSFSIMILLLNYIMNIFGGLLWLKKPFKI
ncbi:MAG: lysylphosphatidylglycerol synthase transmembrane domain-containing protein [Candidatus Undinarchaeales archaeon]|jgi:hypothetical protein|nr:lysylphosphatidylglycerol synthase transmembrane domain-containing protein [Candidatus Undinarchaeales archaeon]